MKSDARVNWSGFLVSKQQQMKKGFILHLDSLSVLDILTDEQAGKLFKAIRNYNLGDEPDLDLSLSIAFLPFKNQFQRDSEKYERTCERNTENGKKGGRPRKPKETEKTQSVISKPKKADNKNDNKNDNNSIISFDTFWNIYDKKSDRAKCLKSWMSIDTNKHSMIYEQAKKYVKSTPDVKFRKNPLTWLNGKCWEDEIKTDSEITIVDPLVEYVFRKTGIR